MSFLSQILRRCREFFRKGKMEAEMAEEMQEHLERRAKINIAAGMSPDEARYAAQRQFGGMDQLKEIAREDRVLLWVEQFLRDLRFAVRQLAKSPGFAAIAVLSLGLGIGACTAVFSIVNGVLLRSLPVPNPQELRVLQWTGTQARIKSFTGESSTDGNRLTGDSVSAPMFSALRGQSASIADVFAFAPIADVTVRARGDAFTANGLVVSDNFFAALGVRPLAGRLFAPGELGGDAAQRVVVTADFWEKHFSGDREILNQTLVLNGASLRIAGVLPREFAGVFPGQVREFYVLLTPESVFLERPMNVTAHWWLRLMARLPPTGSEAQLKAVLDLVFATDPDAQLKEPKMLVQAGSGGMATDRERYRRPLWLMLGIVSLVMVVACANVAGLSLARGAGRQHELAVRAALGAGRWRLLRQSLAESLLLAFLGGGVGILVAGWSKTAIVGLLTESTRGLRYDFPLDLTLLGFTLAAAFITALLAGLLPAWSASRVDPLQGLKARGALGAPRLRVGKFLVAGQIALSLLLLSAAGLFLRTLSNLRNVDAGFVVENLVAFRINPAAAGFDAAQRTAFYAQLQSSVNAIPGVQSAALVMHPLLENTDSWSGGFSFRNRAKPDAGDLQAHRLVVSETFFTTTGIPLLQGREFNAGDVESAAKVIVVNEAFVRRYLANENPLGQTVNVQRADWRIVGVCRDAKTRFIKETVPPMIYFSFRQLAFPFTAVVVRTPMSPGVLANAARQAVAAINPQVPVTQLASQTELRDRSISQERLFATLCGALAGLALLLSCIGLYGLMAYNVTRRSNEIGLRLALGATRGDIARSVLHEAWVLGVVGAGIGLPVTFVVTRLIRAQLYAVQPGDPLTLGIVTCGLLGVTLVAAWLPAWRATRVDPMIALRAD